MTDAITRAAELLKDHRESIDRLDAILVYTLAERFKRTQAVGRLKAEHDLPPVRPRARSAPDRTAGMAFERSRPRPRICQEIPDLHHLGSHQASRTTSEITAQTAVPTKPKETTLCP